MWFGWSVPAWEVIFLSVTIAAAIFSGLGVSAAFLSAIIGYKVTDVVTRDANERISTNETETAHAKEEAAKAIESAAIANERAAKAELELAKFRSPRLPDEEQINSLIEKIRPFAGTKFDVGHGLDDREQMDFMWRLEPAISKAGWVQIDWVGGDTFTKPGWTGNHTYGRTAVTNVSIEVHPQTRDKLMAAAKALADALNGIGIQAVASDFNNTSVNADAIHVLVGIKR